MAARQSGVVDAALAMIGKPDKDGKPITAYRAAIIAGIALSTIYRAIKRSKVSHN